MIDQLDHTLQRARSRIDNWGYEHFPTVVTRLLIQIPTELEFRRDRLELGRVIHIRDIERFLSRSNKPRHTVLSNRQLDVLNRIDAGFDPGDDAFATSIDGVDGQPVRAEQGTDIA